MDTASLNAELNIARRDIDVLKRRLVNADEAMKAALPKYDIENDALSKFIGRLHEQREAVKKVAHTLLADLENVVEGLDPEEAKQVAAMRAIVDSAV